LERMDIIILIVEGVDGMEDMEGSEVYPHI
jgi:hypothetical protein